MAWSRTEKMLLKDLKALLEKKRWHYPLKSSTIYWDGFQSLDNPSAWMPRYLSRFFSRTKTKYDEILGITVAYDWSFHELGFEEPVVCCARIKLEEKVDTWKAAVVNRLFIVLGFYFTGLLPSNFPSWTSTPNSSYNLPFT